MTVTATVQPQQGSDRGGWLDTTFPALARGSLSWNGGRLSHDQVKWENIHLCDPEVKGILILSVEITYSLSDE